MSRLFSKRILCTTLSLIGLLLVGGRSWAEKPGNAPGPVQQLHASAPRPIEANDLKAFFDETMAQHMESQHLPGATVSVVKDGEVFFTKGYGYANLEERIPFDPNTSLVRIASITKLFTWTAVMQLVEQGKLDLNADVNTYLTAFQLPATYPEPVTLAHLMTHTAGFEERAVGVGARSKQEVPPLGAYLAQHLPARVRPPGRIAAYSNHGAALAGYIVAEVSGLPYEQYIQENILNPLAMTHATAWEPVPDHLLADLARSYEYVDGVYAPIPFMYDILMPDGSISASATDMAHFMIAHLQDGRYDAAQILQPSTAQRMHSQSFTHHPRLSGWAHGFAERTINNQHTLLHDGSWEGFQSALILLPQHNLGLFVSYNSPGGVEVLNEMMQGFFDRYFPTSRSPTPPPASLDQPVPEFTGRYKLARSSVTTIEKLVTLLASSRVMALDDGTLRFNGREWVAVEPLLYRDVNGSDMLTFLPDDQGKIRYAIIDRIAYERIPWYETAPFTLALLGGWMALSLSALIGWPIASMLQRRRKGNQEPPDGGRRVARWVAALSSGLALILVVAVAMTLLGDTSEFVYGVPLSFRLLMLLPLLIVALTVVAVVSTVVVWKERYWGLWGRVHYTMVVLGMMVFLWFLNTWNLFPSRYG